PLGNLEAEIPPPSPADAAVPADPRELTEVHVAPADHAQTLLRTPRLPFLEQPRESHRARRFRNAALRFPEQLDRRAYLFIGHGQPFVHQIAAQGIRLRARLTHRRAVAEHVYVIQRHGPPFADGRVHARLIDPLDAHD